MGIFEKIFGGKARESDNPWLAEGDKRKQECRTETLVEAIQFYEKAIEQDPRCAEAWYKKGHCYHLLRRDEEAVTCYDAALAIHPEDAEVWYNKGRSLRILGKDSDATVCQRKAEGLDPRYRDFLYYTITGMVDVIGRTPEGVPVVKPPADPRTWSK
jgi:tetratricopeptide (TPR) repeat protein